jgi:purine-nucleoside/S-methyl-5'-thioadenosine phosphorylase / adenosine deaminase
LGFAVGDLKQRVEENFERFFRMASLKKEQLRTVSQVHGDQVLEFGARNSNPIEHPAADALWTERGRLAVAVKTADCVPILLADPAAKRVAAVHSGWRGTELKVAQRAVEALARQGSRPEEMIAVIGPSIRACCYQVSPSLAERFSNLFGESAVQGDTTEPRLDLILAIHRTLWEAGVPMDHIDVLSHCTACDKNNFFSHRRDRGITGRHLSYIVCQF